MNKGIKITLWALGSAAVIVGGYFAYKAITKKADITGGDGSLSDTGSLESTIIPPKSAQGMSNQQVIEQIKKAQSGQGAPINMNTLSAAQHAAIKQAMPNVVLAGQGKG